MPHPAATHFVNIETRCLVCIMFGNILQTCYSQHFGTLIKKILDHFVVVIIITYRGDQLRNSPFIFLILAQSYMVSFFRKGFTLHIHTGMPWAWFCNSIFIVTTDTILALLEFRFAIGV